MVLRLNYLQVVNIEVTGTKLVSESAVRNSVLLAITGNYFKVIPKSDALLLPREKIRARLLAEFPEAESVDFSLPHLDTFAVIVREREPFALWCGSDSTAPQPCDFLDHTGLAFTTAPEFSGSVFLQYFGALAATSTPAQYLSPKSFAALAGFAETIKDLFLVEKITATADGDYELEASNGTKLLVAGDQDLSAAFNSLKLFLDGSAVHDPLLYEYLDLRFAGKVFYKVRQ